MSPIRYVLSYFSFLFIGLSFSKWFAAVYTGLVAAAYCCLLINGFVGFQFAEDGTPLSLWVRSEFYHCYIPSNELFHFFFLQCLSSFVYLASSFSVPPFSSPLPPSNNSSDSHTPNPSLSLLYTSSGLSSVSPSTSSPNSFSSSELLKTDGQ